MTSERNGSQNFGGAQAGGHIVGGNLTQTNDYGEFDINVEAIRGLVQKLEEEVKADLIRNDWIEDLQFFEENLPDDDHEGLEAKLLAAGAGHKKLIAFRQKEQFAKFLEKRSLYRSAQQLVALCLHKIFTEFDILVYPRCGELSSDELFEFIYGDIVKPIVKNYSYGSFLLSHSVVMGMTYWLADRCYVRWHQVA